MFTRFKSHFHLDDGPREISTGQLRTGDAELVGFFSRFEGLSFNNGLYRVMDARSAASAEAFIEAAFPKFASRTQTFAYDWLGRIFALDSDRCEEKARAVTMFEPGTGEALETPCNLVTFHESELVDHNEAALAISFYQGWLASGGAVPALDQCIGYKKPLFIGGEDEVVNLEISDLDVYWNLSGQLIQKTHNLAPGTRIGKVSFDG